MNIYPVRHLWSLCLYHKRLFVVYRLSYRYRNALPIKRKVSQTQPLCTVGIDCFGCVTPYYSMWVSSQVKQRHPKLTLLLQHTHKYLRLLITFSCSSAYFKHLSCLAVIKESGLTRHCSCLATTLHSKISGVRIRRKLNFGRSNLPKKSAFKEYLLLQVGYLRIFPRLYWLFKTCPQHVEVIDSGKMEPKALEILLIDEKSMKTVKVLAITSGNSNTTIPKFVDCLQ